MRWIDLKISQKLLTVFGLFIIGFISISVWDYIQISKIGGGNNELLSRFLVNHIVLALIFSLISMGMIFAVNKSFQSTLKAAEKLSEGDLTFNISSIRKDELGQIDASLLTIKNRLRTFIEHVKETTANLTAASSELNSGSQLISNGANDQASTSTEISMTMDQIAMISKQSTNNANETNEIAKRAYEGIIKGAEDLNRALQVIEEIAQKNSVISEISYQTKILSINASVEAARAAEWGKGFSVIAEHIKRLAETTQTSAAEIETVSKLGVKITRNSAMQLRELVSEFHKTSELTQMVADSGSEQYVAIEQVNLSMQGLNDVTQQNASSSEELTASSEELVRLSESLNSQTLFFKLTKEELENAPDFEETMDQEPEFTAYNETSFNFNSRENEERETGNEYESEFSKLFSDRLNQRTEQDVIEQEVIQEEEPKKEDKPITPRTKSKPFEEESAQKTKNSGVKISLTDNDEIDRQFEKFK